MAENLIEKIEQNMHTFTPKQKVIAVAILQDPLAASFYSVKEFAEKIGVSPSSVVRFAQEITDGGFPQLQAELHAHVQSVSNPIKRLEMNVITNTEDDALLAHVFDNQISNLRKTFNQNLMHSVNRAAELILQASHTYTCGSRGSYATAYYLGHHLNRTLNNVDIVPDDSRLIDFLMRATSEDVVILFCMPRYRSRLLTLAKHLKSIGAKLITFNTSPKSPFIPYSDISFYVFNQSNDFHNSALASMLVAEMLISLIISKDVGRALDNLGAMEPIFHDLEQFIDV